jgi:hypothetical protein
MFLGTEPLSLLLLFFLLKHFEVFTNASYFFKFFFLKVPQNRQIKTWYFAACLVFLFVVYLTLKCVSDARLKYEVWIHK